MHLGPADRQVGSEKLRVNPRKSWYSNLEEVTAKRRLRGHLPPEAAAAGLAGAAGVGLVAGLSLPCRAARDAHPSDRHRPLQIRRVQAERGDQSRPEIRITGSRAGPISTASNGTIMPRWQLAQPGFHRRQVRHLSPYGMTVPLLKDVKSQAPQAICEMTPTNCQPHSDRQPGTSRRSTTPELRRAMALSLDRKAFIDIIHRGQGDIGGDHAAAARRGLGDAAGDAEDTCRAMIPMSQRTAPKPARSWRSSATAPTTGSRSPCPSRNIAAYRDAGGDPDRPAEGDLYRRPSSRPVDTTNWYPQDHAARTSPSASMVTESGVDDPDQQFYENYVCGAVRNYTGYCNPEVDKLIDQQSAEADREKRKQLVWEIERKLAEDSARPVIFYPRGGTCTAALGQGAHDRWSTASTTATAWKTSGSTSSSAAGANKREEGKSESKFSRSAGDG